MDVNWTHRTEEEMHVESQAEEDATSWGVTACTQAQHDMSEGLRERRKSLSIEHYWQSHMR